jgi:hypothetical protein
MGRKRELDCPYRSAADSIISLASFIKQHCCCAIEYRWKYGDTG